MAQKIIKTVFMIRRDTTVNWEVNKAVIPAVGEPCFDTDLGILKIGDGVTTYENLPAINATITADEKSITFDGGVLQLVGFEDAEVGAQLTKGANDKLLWVVPSTDTVEGLQTTVAGLDRRVAENENAIATLNGAGEGSISKAIDDAINAFAEDISNDGVVNSFKELVTYVADHAPEAADMAADIVELQGLVGPIPVSEQIASLDVGEDNIIESVSVNATTLDVVNKNVNIPVATEDELGVIKGSTEIVVGADGSLTINTISFDKIVEGEDIIFFDGGTSSTVVTME